jgi:predicted amino acid-binding ACT domain protein
VPRVGVITYLSILIGITNFQLKAIKQFVISNKLTIEMPVFVVNCIICGYKDTLISHFVYDCV